jgi:ABC-type multidrug transport system fused ATPase/permease subunit
MALSTATDAANALGRLKHVFVAEEIAEAYAIDPKADKAIVVKNASFVWETAPPAPSGSGPVGGTGAKKVDATEKEKGGRRKFWRKAKDDYKKKSQESQPDYSKKIEEEKDTKPVGEKTDVDQSKEPEADGKVSEEADTGSSTAVHDKPTESLELRDIDFEVPHGQLCAIVGPGQYPYECCASSFSVSDRFVFFVFNIVGSGKSSLLQALVGEMKRLEGEVVFSGKVGYCAQQAWIQVWLSLCVRRMIVFVYLWFWGLSQNATVRENIVFGQPWDEKKYWQVVSDACLNADLDMLPNGDHTEIGERVCFRRDYIVRGS